MTDDNDTTTANAFYNGQVFYDGLLLQSSNGAFRSTRLRIPADRRSPCFDAMDWPVRVPELTADTMFFKLAVLTYHIDTYVPGRNPAYEYLLHLAGDSGAAGLCTISGTDGHPQAVADSSTLFGSGFLHWMTEHHPLILKAMDNIRNTSTHLYSR
jgi:hypothetical protein